MPHDDGRLVEAERIRQPKGRSGWHANLFSKSAGPLDAHHSGLSGGIRAIFVARVKRHAAGSADAVANLPLRHTGADGVDHARAVDAGDQRQFNAALRLLAATNRDIEHAVHGRRMNHNANLAAARCRIRQILVTHHIGRAELPDDDRLHASLPLILSRRRDRARR